MAPGKGLVAIDESYPALNTQLAYTGDALCHSKETAPCRFPTKGFKKPYRNLCLEFQMKWKSFFLSKLWFVVSSGLIEENSDES